MAGTAFGVVREGGYSSFIWSESPFLREICIDGTERMCILYQDQID